jgi:hypothetical protein
VVDVEPVENAPAPSARTSRRATEDREAECRLKTFTTAYAKDLAVAGKISTDGILGWSELLFRYLQGEVTVSDDEVNEVIKKAKAVEEDVTARPSARKTTASRTMEGAAR